MKKKTQLPGSIDQLFEKSGCSSSRLDKSNPEQKSFMRGNIFKNNENFISRERDASSSSSSLSRIMTRQQKQQLFESQFLKFFENED